MPQCLNCLAENLQGATRCHSCHIPGDFGQAASPKAKILAPALVDCDNCGGRAPVQAAHCPQCRWPLPRMAPVATPAEEVGFSHAPLHLRIA